VSNFSSLFEEGADQAYWAYVQHLTAALKFRDHVYDPSHALASDADVYRKVMRAPIAAHAIRFRRHLAAGHRAVVEPATDSDDDKAAAEIVEELLGDLLGFTDARVRLADAIFRGSAYALICGERRMRSVGDDGPVLAWWAPTALVDARGPPGPATPCCSRATAWSTPPPSTMRATRRANCQRVSALIDW